MRCSEPGGASRLQSLRPVCRVAELGSFTQPMKLPCLWIALLLTASITGEEVGKVIDRLPAVRKQALRETVTLRGGNNADMVDAAIKVRKALLPSLVILEAALTKQNAPETQKLIERDLEAIERAEHIRGHAEGWGGAQVKVDAAWAAVEHVESRVSWCVWQLMQNRKNLVFDDWLNRWAESSEAGSRADGRGAAVSR